MTLLKVSLVTSFAIVAAMLLGKLIDKKYNVRWRYFVWLILSLRLLIPFSVNLPQAPLKITSKPYPVVLRTDRSFPLGTMPENRTENNMGDNAQNPADYETNSANYAPIFDLRTLLSVVWGIGAIASFSYSLIQYALFRKRIKITSADLGICKIGVYFAKEIEMPMLIGFFKPCILLPEKDYSPDELGMIVLHEQTHKKRGDLWYKLLLLTVRSVHWFNPFVHMMVNSAKRDLEYCCDYDVCRGKSMDFRKKYSLTILNSMKTGKAGQ